MTHNIYLEWHKDMKVSGFVQPIFLYHPWRFQIFMSLYMVFMDLQMSKIRCLNYAHFPKSCHTAIYSYILCSCSWLCIAKTSAIHYIMQLDLICELYILMNMFSQIPSHIITIIIIIAIDTHVLCMDHDLNIIASLFLEMCSQA